MLSYLAAEAAFLRMFGGRTMLLLLFCALARTGDKVGSVPLLGITLGITQGIIVVFGPFLTLLFLLSLKVEADNLRLVREVALKDATNVPSEFARRSRTIMTLFYVPLLAATFLVIQYGSNVIPASEICGHYGFWQQFTNLGYLSGTASIYCIRNLSEGMPWIYPPFQMYAYLVCLTACFAVTRRISKEWIAFRS